LHILADCLSILDYDFVSFTVKRRKATLRISSKKGRPKQKLACVLESYPYQIKSSNDVVEKVVYNTRLEKRGISLLIGNT
jgi:hypothetical protein